mmetsp:Transcript_54975/g.167086  ORF Transcript_54975/g.167086 Transcript_54975/m.167086 type:complete len:244 (+) Transcript_54975:906-1637(+)
MRDTSFRSSCGGTWWTNWLMRPCPTAFWTRSGCLCPRGSMATIISILGRRGSWRPQTFSWTSRGSGCMFSARIRPSTSSEGRSSGGCKGCCPRRLTRTAFATRLPNSFGRSRFNIFVLREPFAHFCGLAYPSAVQGLAVAPRQIPSLRGIRRSAGSDVLYGAGVLVHEAPVGCVANIWLGRFPRTASVTTLPRRSCGAGAVLSSMSRATVPCVCFNPLRRGTAIRNGAPPAPLAQGTSAARRI